MSHMPTYPGSFVGHRVELGGVYVPKRLAWVHKDKETGKQEWRFMRGQSFQPFVFVWNGKEWLDAEAFELWRKTRYILSQIAKGST